MHDGMFDAPEVLSMVCEMAVLLHVMLWLQDGKM
jgi:hypothetical protein